MSKNSKQEEIALFRFGLISAVIHNSQDNQTEYFKKMAQTLHSLPCGESKKYHWRTFKSWLHRYRKGGFDALKPKARSDEGGLRIVSAGLDQIIRKKLDDFPSMSVSLLYRMLSDEGIINGRPAESTLRRFVKSQNLRRAAEPPVPRKKFEKPFANDLWISDFLHGPSLSIDDKKRKVFLVAIIDDHSRFIVSARWAFAENTQTLELALKDAISAFGLPKIFYCDNGAVFVSSHLQLVCARLGIALVHSKPYDSPSRGKIERFNRTVREGFLSIVPLNQSWTLQGFNERFKEWLDAQYHRRFHHGINEMPLDRYCASAAECSIRRVERGELALCFFQTFTRKVKNDSTVSVDGILFEVPPGYIGSIIELRHPTGEPYDLWLYDNNTPLLKVNKVNVHENSSRNQRGINFNSLHEEDI